MQLDEHSKAHLRLRESMRQVTGERDALHSSLQAVRAEWAATRDSNKDLVQQLHWREQLVRTPPCHSPSCMQAVGPCMQAVAKQPARAAALQQPAHAWPTLPCQACLSRLQRGMALPSDLTGTYPLAACGLPDKFHSLQPACSCSAPRPPGQIVLFLSRLSWPASLPAPATLCMPPGRIHKQYPRHSQPADLPAGPHPTTYKQGHPRCAGGRRGRSPPASPAGSLAGGVLLLCRPREPARRGSAGSSATARGAGPLLHLQPSVELLDMQAAPLLANPAALLEVTPQPGLAVVNRPSGAGCLPERMLPGQAARRGGRGCKCGVGARPGAGVSCSCAGAS